MYYEGMKSLARSLLRSVGPKGYVAIAVGVVLISWLVVQTDLLSIAEGMIDFNYPNQDSESAGFELILVLTSSLVGLSLAIIGLITLFQYIYKKFSKGNTQR